MFRILASVSNVIRDWNLWLFHKASSSLPDAFISNPLILMVSLLELKTLILMENMGVAKVYYWQSLMCIFPLVIVEFWTQVFEAEMPHLSLACHPPKKDWGQISKPVTGWKETFQISIN